MVQRSIVVMAMTWILAGAPSAETASEPIFRNTCDASAAFFEPGGDLVVADDRTDVMNAYSPKGGAPLRPVDMYAFTGTNRWARRNFSAFEAVAPLGDKLYFLTSHARDRKRGANRPYRRRFFAVRPMMVDGRQEFKQVGATYKKLNTALTDSKELRRTGVASSIMELHRELPYLSPDQRGLSLQALAAGRDGSTLLIGLRNPRLGGRSIVIPFLNPERVALGLADPTFSNAIFLDLGGQGIADMVLDSAEGNYLISTGPDGSGTGGRLYRWSGEASDPPKQLESFTRENFEPQALALDGGNRLLVLSDDGLLPFAVKRREECKRPLDAEGMCACHDLVDESRKQFRGQWVDLAAKVSGKP
ncbi:MAG: hypothetical protein CBC48_04020 [bacterium TMED88]|nr:hypothetical protein [Deltaproteobacteria bacterium]OUV35435.1 MAG: hypothetical protein CBC48_04020 [bacterium TMED88]